MSGVRTSPRGDVGAKRRRSWSTEQKQATVAEIDVGDATLSEVARRHGVHVNVLFRWHRELGSAMGATPGDAAAATTAPATSFVPVTLSSPSTPASTPTQPGAIEIMLADGRTVRVGSDVVATLVRIVEALEARRCEGLEVAPIDLDVGEKLGAEIGDAEAHAAQAILRRMQVSQWRGRPQQHQAVRAVLPLDRRSAALGEEGLLALLQGDGPARVAGKGYGQRQRQVALPDIDGRARQIDDRQGAGEGRQAQGRGEPAAEGGRCEPPAVACNAAGNDPVRDAERYAVAAPRALQPLRPG